jgi:hypothetical protein
MIDNWAKDKSIDIALSAPDDISHILTMDFVDLYDYTSADILQVLFKVSSYLNYLYNEIGRLQSSLSYHEETYKDKLYAVSSSFKDFYSTDERAAAARRSDKKLQEMHEIVLENRYKYYRIKQFAEGINKFSMMLYKILEHKKNEERSGGKSATVGHLP